VQLEDDRHYFPPYQAVPLVRVATLERYPQLRDVLNRLAGKIDPAAMRQMNREVDRERKNPEEVAQSFLRRKGLLLKD
jgi:glycine betaine/choline ABC-type transport system substrate-binding protein